MSYTVKILIIGGGQIGSRHLQGILKSQQKLSITIVDPNLESLRLSKRRANEIKFGNINSTITFKQNFPKKEKFKICIISTNANIRANVTESLLSNCFVEYIIFEKILFQKNSDFDKISKILNKKKIKAWVNCPRRIVPIYQEIKKSLDTKSNIEMVVEGSSWGMACNAIHFIDLFSYLANSSNLIITNSNFHNTLQFSKRDKNSYELNGSIECKIKNHILKISCEENTDRLIFLKITNGKNKYTIDEIRGVLKNKNEKIKTQYPFVPNQSNMSESLVNDLINHNKCNLITFKDSCKLHIPLLSEFRIHFSKILNKELSECPIT
jgi:hypothetical protein